MIYLITNKNNNKKYVGKTSRTVAARFAEHCRCANRGSQTYFHKAIRKYGADSFNIDILDENYSNDLEILWISRLAPEYNMTPGGDGGHIHDQTGSTWKVSDSRNMGKTFREGKNHTVSWYQAVKGGANYQCNYLIITPWGSFDTWISAIKAARLLKNQGHKNVITDTNTLQKYCKEDIILNKEGRRTYPEWRGKSTRELGFNFKAIPKEIEE